MTRIQKVTRPLLCLLLAASLLLSACSAPRPAGGRLSTKKPEQTQSAPLPDVLRAVTVRAGDYPGKALDGAGLQQAAKALCERAALYSMNALLYEVTADGQALWPSDILPRSSYLGGADPLGTLVEAAQEQGIAVYAVLTPYEAGPAGGKAPRGSLPKEHPESTVTLADGSLYYRPSHPLVHAQAMQAAQELCERYPLSGLMVGDADTSPVSDYEGYYTYLTALVSDLRDAVRAAKGTRMQVGLSLSSEARDSQNRQAFLEECCRQGVAFLTPALSESVTGGLNSPYARELSSYRQTAQGYGAAVYPAFAQDGERSAGYAAEALFISNQLGLQGGVVEGYDALLEEDGYMQAVIPMLYLSGSLLPDIDLSYPQTFRITRPLDGTRLTLDPSYDAYFITGTSDPDAPVYFGEGEEEEEIARAGEDGLFGVLVELEDGENTFTFRQGEETVQAAIYRRPADETTKISKISTYINSGSPGSVTFQPYGPQVVTEDIPMLFQCIAPAGGEVSAILNGERYALEQLVEAEEGTPVTFRLQANIIAPDPDAVTSIGYVTYELKYQGETSEAKAPGEVFLVGKNRQPVVRVREGMGNVLNEGLQGGDFMTTLKTGSTAVVTGMLGNYFITSFGGYIHRKEVEVMTELLDADNHISSAEWIPADARGEERLVLHGTVPPSFVVDEGEGEGFSIRLFDCFGVDDGPIDIDSQFFASLSAQNSPDGTLTLTFKPGLKSYFGYNVTYDGNDTILLFRDRPQLSPQVGRPLLGLRIVVDPGHGANDVGALGVPGTTGPMEKNVNLYAAHITAKLLEAMGAEVYMTRETDEDFLELHERVRFTEQHEADLFLSVHHNSTSEAIDPHRVEGTWVFYYNAISAGIAEAYLQAIAAATGRKAQGTENAYYVVCRNTLAPSVLLELGFMPNPEEYAAICKTDTMLDIGRAICEATVDYIGSLQEE